MQVKKYISGLEKQLILINSDEPIEAICVVGKKLKDWDTSEKEERGKQSLSIDRIRVVTYSQLIHDSYESYQAYIGVSQKNSKILDLMSRIDKEL
jgi:hypothetical protein